MKYLLDVNVLVALCLDDHEFHKRVSAWVNGFAPAGHSELMTCAITELGFLRILAQAPSYSFTIEQGKQLLTQLKSNSKIRFSFLADDAEIEQLPLWVKGPKQITDGHLLELAKGHEAMLATLDERIPGASVIPSKR
jgi:predicted nucleic acid-binding protein